MRESAPALTSPTEEELAAAKAGVNEGPGFAPERNVDLQHFIYDPAAQGQSALACIAEYSRSIWVSYTASKNAAPSSPRTPARTNSTVERFSERLSKA